MATDTMITCLWFDHGEARRLAAVAPDRVAGDHAKNGLDRIGHVLVPQDFSEAMSITKRYLTSPLDSRS